MSIWIEAERLRHEMRKREQQIALKRMLDDQGKWLNSQKAVDWSERVKRLGETTAKPT